MSIGDNIKRRREELALTQEELAKKLGFKNRSTVNKWEKDGSSLKQKRIEEIANVLNCSPAYLMGWESEPILRDVDIFKYENIRPITTQRIPFLGEIACGQPIFADEDRESYIEVGIDIKADFCLRCKGDSMINANIFDGYIVFIRKQPIVENGEIAAVIIDNDATLKRVYYYKDRGLLILRAENSKYDDLMYSGEELNNIRILGKAVAFQGDVK